MLRFLRVRNFALIDHLEIHLEDSFNLLSGETGAGKSIIVDALGLIAGSKASTDTIRTGETRAVVEAVFEADISAELERRGLDTESSEVIIRREISSDGRNRVFINSQPSTVSALKELAPSLLDIHGQHDQQTLMDSSSQLDLIDAWFAGGTLPQSMGSPRATAQKTATAPVYQAPAVQAPQAAPPAAEERAPQRWWSLDDGRSHTAEQRAGGQNPSAHAQGDEFPRIVRTRLRG